MKKYLIFVYILLLGSTLVACSKDSNAPETKPVVLEKFPVPPTVSAMNIKLGNRRFNVEMNKDGWGGLSRRAWEAKAGIPTQVILYNSFQKSDRENGALLDIVFTIKAPPMPIVDPEDQTLRFDKTYNYSTLLNWFRKGNYPLRSTENTAGYEFFISSVDLSKPTESFSYNTFIGSQAGSKWEVIKVEEVYGQGMYVTFEIDCNIYTNSLQTKELIKERMVGTIQVEHRYQPL
jgi:hypothetical protein